MKHKISTQGKSGYQFTVVALSVLLLFIFSSLVLGLPDDAENRIDFTYSTRTVNYSLVGVNDSKFFRGHDYDQFVITDGAYAYTTSWGPLQTHFADSAADLNGYTDEDFAILNNSVHLHKDIDNLYELISDPSFDDSSQWNLTTGWTVSGGNLNHSSVSDGLPVTQLNPILAEIGQSYLVSIVVPSSGAIFRASYGGVNVINDVDSGTGTYTAVVTATSNNGLEMTIAGGGSISVSSVSVKRIYTATFGSVAIKKDLIMDYLRLNGATGAPDAVDWELIAGKGLTSTFGGVAAGIGGDMVIKAGNGGNYTGAGGGAGNLILGAGGASDGKLTGGETRNGGYVNITATNAIGSSDKGLGGDIFLNAGRGIFGGINGSIIVNQQIKSTLTGRSPFNISSTVVNPNLNADMLDGSHSSSFGILSSTSTWTRIQNFNGGLNSSNLTVKNFIGINTTNPIYPLEVQTMINGTSAWFKGNGSFAGINIRSEVNNDTELFNKFKDGNELKSQNVINHKALPECYREVPIPDETKPVYIIETYEEVDYTRPVEISHEIRRCVKFNGDGSCRQHNVTYEYETVYPYNITIVNNITTYPFMKISEEWSVDCFLARHEQGFALLSNSAKPIQLTENLSALDTNTLLADRILTKSKVIDINTDYTIKFKDKNIFASKLTHPAKTALTLRNGTIINTLDLEDRNAMCEGFNADLMDCMEKYPKWDDYRSCMLGGLPKK
jgi:hypothetical protein